MRWSSIANFRSFRIIIKNKIRIKIIHWLRKNNKKKTLSNLNKNIGRLSLKINQSNINHHHTKHMIPKITTWHQSSRISTLTLNSTSLKKRMGENFLPNLKVLSKIHSQKKNHHSQPSKSNTRLKSNKTSH